MPILLVGSPLAHWPLARRLCCRLLPAALAATPASAGLPPSALWRLLGLSLLLRFALTSLLPATVAWLSRRPSRSGCLLLRCHPLYGCLLLNRCQHQRSSVQLHQFCQAPIVLCIQELLQQRGLQQAAGQARGAGLGGHAWTGPATHAIPAARRGAAAAAP